MKATVKEEPNATKLPKGGDPGQQNRHGGQRGCCWNNAAGAGGSPGQNATAKYPTRNKELPENLVFDNTGRNDAANFQRSLKGMAKFMHTTYSAKVAEAILKMQAVNIPIQDEPKARADPDTGKPLPLTSWDKHKWKQTNNEQMAKLKIYRDSIPKAYIHIYNQCSTNLKNDLMASAAFPQVKSTKDPIGLLKLILFVRRKHKKLATSLKPLLGPVSKYDHFRDHRVCGNRK